MIEGSSRAYFALKTVVRRDGWGLENCSLKDKSFNASGDANQILLLQKMLFNCFYCIKISCQSNTLIHWGKYFKNFHLAIIQQNVTSLQGLKILFPGQMITFFYVPKLHLLQCMSQDAFKLNCLTGL